MLSQKFWSKYFKTYDILNLVIPYQELLNELVNELQPKEGEIILDAGGGTGNLALMLEKLGVNVIVLDFSQEALEIYKKKNPNGKIVLADLRKQLPFEDNFFDKIVSNNTIYNIPPDERPFVLNELKRVLKPGGKIVISNIHKYFSPFFIYKDAIRKNIKKEGLMKTFYLVVTLIVPTIKMFYYNFIIKNELGFEKKFLFDLKEQENLLKEVGFINVSPTKLVYSGQAILNSAIKP